MSYLRHHSTTLQLTPASKTSHNPAEIVCGHQFGLDKLVVFHGGTVDEIEAAQTFLSN